MTFLIPLVHTEIKIKLNLDSPVHEEYVSLNLMFALHKYFMSFWAPMDNVVEIKLIIVRSSQVDTAMFFVHMEECTESTIP